ncbi:MAG: hypothetical protein ACJ78Q_02100 [Chloroflexia bacterium]
MFVMRYTVIDPAGTVSFVAPCTALKALVAACSKAPSDLESLLSATERYDNELKDYVLNGLSIFDEHNSNGSYDQIHSALDYADEQRSHHSVPAFRVVDETTRQASLEPVKAGLVLFNLKARRIIQVHNTYADVKRRDRGRIHEGGVPTRRLYHYELPREWEIVP